MKGKERGGGGGDEERRRRGKRAEDAKCAFSFPPNSNWSFDQFSLSTSLDSFTVK